ncbi:hypothetical protein JRI60_48970 [Archangium violaceum]|uniref:hypothetical protein n=1 Tax=Archangium violaceum TaxID=83451 RepID=UPI00194E3D03|nr:hypothetical protein [Archangium violaceum]QRN96831.1 hypothetical protein JRI60_48970 [Archangium violaceum]
MSRRAVLGLTVVVWAAVAVAQPAEDMTGVYRKDGGELVVLQSDKETLLYYGAGFPQGQSVGTCECPLMLQRKESATRWSLKSTDADDTWTLRLEPGQLVLEDGSPECCGAGWPGRDTFPRKAATPPQSCKVTAPRAYFHGSDASNTQRKAFVVAGDTVQVYVPPIEPDLVPARFVGPKSSTVGLLRRDQLDCKAQGRDASATPAVDVKPIAGRWVRVQRNGKEYVIERPCSAETPAFSLQANGAMQVEYGQEGEQVKVTGLKPGKSGAYTLEVTSSSGSRETLEWTVADAKRNIIRLKGGGNFFQDGPLFVREDKKGSIPVRAEKCDEYE